MLLRSSSKLVLTQSTRLLRMSTNATGLAPEATKQLKERAVQAHEEPIIKALKEV